VNIVRIFDAGEGKPTLLQLNRSQDCSKFPLRVRAAPLIPSGITTANTRSTGPFAHPVTASALSRRYPRLTIRVQDFPLPSVERHCPLDSPIADELSSTFGPYQLCPGPYNYIPYDHDLKSFYWGFKLQKPDEAFVLQPFLAQLLKCMTMRPQPWPYLLSQLLLSRFRGLR